MTSLLSTDNSAPSSSSSPCDVDEVLTGLRHIKETSDSQDKRLLSNLVMQAEEVKQRDQSIISMQSKLDSQQAIMEQIRSEQQQLMSAVASFSESNAQNVSAELFPPVILETPEPKTPAANPERSPSVFSVPKLLPLQKTPTPTFFPSYRNSIPVAHANLRVATADNRWKAPQHYMETQQGSQLRRQGAFYGTPDWGTMTVISSAVPDAPPSSPASPQTQDEVTSTAGKSRADVRMLVEVKHDLRAAAADNQWKAPQHYMETQQGGQLRRQGAFYGTPDWGTMTVISSAVPYAPPSPPASPQTQDEVASTAGKSRADVRMLVEVEHDLRAAAADNRWKAPQHYMETQQGGQLRRQGAFYGTPDWGTMTVISSAVPDAPPSSDVRALMEVEQEADAAVDGVKAASSRNSCKRCRDPDEQDARKAANRMNISTIIHTAPDAPSKRRRVSRDIVESDAVSDVKRPVRRSPRRG
ncbi:hypothetical protein CY34DRAFT_13454 [Suillus luteus UH-Slu-Lm8-n1]|uniref:Unplaced genomic scaffold CY34scaffold_158, whole genome shotgun sequence n=1 Tax=Suillus luteus UH-Slu-Lm8-n1 TaxID=930992 RepID=A0A0D0AGD0_9AGAM|nr:hypothetical protein CY34DRAFT_13454 [Suillus luteus UH-Slu-Lm8-n1]